MTAQDDILLPREAAELLKVSRSTLQRLVDQEGLPAMIARVGPNGRRLLRFRRGEVQEWIAGRRARQLTDWTRYERKPKETS